MPATLEVRKICDMLEKTNSQSPVLTGAKQTMAAWTKVIESYEAVPTIYKGFFEAQIADNRQFPYTLLAPILIKPNGKTTEKLIYDANNAIHILERSGSQIITKIYPYQTVYKVEVGNILLSSWLTISGINSTGETSTTTIDFSTTSVRHYATFLNKLRPDPQGVDEAELNAEKSKFDYLSEISFKLMNFGRSSLVNGEIVIHSLMQSEIREPLWKPLGNLFQRMISPTHLTILTNQELILIHERDQDLPGPHYGGVWQYIPLRSITSVSLSEPFMDRTVLSITLSSGEMIKKIFDASSQPELEQICNQVQGLIQPVA